MEYPKKALLLKSFLSGDQWDYEAVDALLEKEGVKSDYARWTARFWLMEMLSGGLLEIVEEEVDTGSHFGEGKVVSKYRITEYGRSRLAALVGD